jgi:hypothetical protein
VTVLLLIPTPKVTINPSEPLVVEMLEHWAAKLCLNGGKEEVALAVEVHEAAQAFRKWREENPGVRIP